MSIQLSVLSREETEKIFGELAGITSEDKNAREAVLKDEEMKTKAQTLSWEEFVVYVGGKSKRGIRIAKEDQDRIEKYRDYALEIAPKKGISIEKIEKSTSSMEVQLYALIVLKILGL